MAEKLQVYKCEVCENIVELLHGGKGNLVCCGKPMKLFTENTTDAAREKHVPVIEKLNGALKVKVGSVAHPMEEKHYIEWIEVIADGKDYREFLKPGEAPGNIATCMAYGRVRRLINQEGKEGLNINRLLLTIPFPFIKKRLMIRKKI
jgi:superoxide reductase